MKIYRVLHSLFFRGSILVLEETPFTLSHVILFLFFFFFLLVFHGRDNKRKIL